MPEGTRVWKCVQDLKAKGTKGNIYAICQSATGQSYATGKPTKHAARLRSAHKRQHGY